MTPRKNVRCRRSGCENMAAPGRKYCSDACKSLQNYADRREKCRQNNIDHPRTCARPGCGKTFVVTVEHGRARKYCPDGNCAKEARYQRESTAEKPPRVKPDRRVHRITAPHKCGYRNCDKDVPPNDLGNYNLYCNDACCKNEYKERQRDRRAAAPAAAIVGGVRAKVEAMVKPEKRPLTELESIGRIPQPINKAIALAFAKSVKNFDDVQRKMIISANPNLCGYFWEVVVELAVNGIVKPVQAF